jgi:hypothetical protein
MVIYNQHGYTGHVATDIVHVIDAELRILQEMRYSTLEEKTIQAEKVMFELLAVTKMLDEGAREFTTAMCGAIKREEEFFAGIGEDEGSRFELMLSYLHRRLKEAGTLEELNRVIEALIKFGSAVIVTYRLFISKDLEYVKTLKKVSGGTPLPQF